LVEAKTVGADLEHNTSELGNDDLESEDTDPDSKEDHVLAKSLEGVKFIMDHARAEHVDNLEHHEGGEEESEMTGRATGLEAHFSHSAVGNEFPDSSDDFTSFFGHGVEFRFNVFGLDLVYKGNARSHGTVRAVSAVTFLVLAVERVFSFPVPGLGSTGVDEGLFNAVMSSGDVPFRDDEFSPESNSKEDDRLPDGVPHDVLNHLARDEVIVLVLRLTFKELGGRSTSGESEGGKRVHDEVNPK